MPLIERALAESGVDVTVATTDDDGPGAHLSVPLGQPQNGDGATRFYFRKQTDFYKISLPFGSWLKEHAADYDLVHVHALFSYTSTCAARLARRKGIPYIIRPLGVLNRYGMTKRRPALKEVSFRFIERPLLRSAAAIHFTSQQERIEAEALRLSGPACLIPLGIELRQESAVTSQSRLRLAGMFEKRWPATSGRKIVLFLSRIDQKKGLENLLTAFAEAQKTHPKGFLVIAGDGDPAYLQGLRLEAERFGLADHIIWTGHLGLAEKLSAFAAADVFCLPSHSENFGLVVAEALASGVPVITTKGTPWQELETHRCGWWVDVSVEPLARALREALSLFDDERKEMGQRGRVLIESKYTWPRVASQLRSVYEWILGRGPKPECVVDR